MDETEKISEEEKTVCEVVLEKSEEKMKEIMSNEGITRESVDYLYKLVDIHKDLKNEDYWKEKEENMMRYGNYDARRRDSRGRYMEGGYGRRGVAGTGRGGYRGYGNYSDGEEMLEDMKESYGAYNESMNAYNRGNYGAAEDGMKALEDTMELFTEFTEKMVEQAESPEEKQIVKKYLKKVGQMGG